MPQGRIDSTGNYMHYIIDQMSKWVGVVESQGSNCKEKKSKMEWKKQGRTYGIGLELEVTIVTHNSINHF